MSTQFNCQTFLFQTIQFSQTILIQLIQFNISTAFVYTQLKTCFNTKPRELKRLAVI